MLWNAVECCWDAVGCLAGEGVAYLRSAGCSAAVSLRMQPISGGGCSAAVLQCCSALEDLSFTVSIAIWHGETPCSCTCHAISDYLLSFMQPWHECIAHFAIALACSSRLSCRMASLASRICLRVSGGGGSSSRSRNAASCCSL